MQKFYFYRLSASSDPENYRYIGVTVNTVEKRLSGHKYCAMHAKKRELPVHKWMWKHYQLGETILTEKIFECDESEWEYHEKRLIQKYRDLGYNLLNIDCGGKGVITKEKRSTSSIERSVKAHETPIYAIDPKTMEIAYEFESTVKATAFFKLKSKSAINNVLKGRSKTSAGYYWVYKLDWDSGLNKINKESGLEKLKHPLYRFDFDGNFICRYESEKAFQRIENIKDASSAKNACENKTFYLNSFWSRTESINIEEYHNIYFIVAEYDINGNVVNKYHTQNEIAKKYNKCCATISNLIKNKLPLPNGNYLKLIKDKI